MPLHHSPDGTDRDRPADDGTDRDRPGDVGGDRPGAVGGDRPGDVEAEKARLRGQAMLRRRAMTAQEVAAARSAVAAHLRQHLAGHPVVAGYLPLPTEPLDPGLLPALRAAGSRVLVPVAAAGTALDWAEFGGPVRRSGFGIEEPVGPRLGADAVALATAVLVPALLVDRRGVRLGRGGGHYDRTLAAATGELIAVVFDDEWVDALPAGPYDLPVTAVVTPGRGVLRLPAAR